MHMLLPWLERERRKHTWFSVLSEDVPGMTPKWKGVLKSDALSVLFSSRCTTIFGIDFLSSIHVDWCARVYDILSARCLLLLSKSKTNKLMLLIQICECSIPVIIKTTHLESLDIWGGSDLQRTPYFF